MAQPYTIKFGPWLPDLMNIAVETQYQYSEQEIPCADILNVYYSNGTYKSLPTAVSVNGSPILPVQCVGAFTFTDPDGNTIPIVGGIDGNPYYFDGAWNKIGNQVGLHANYWNFAQFGSLLYGQYVPAVIAGPGAFSNGGALFNIAFNGTLTNTGAPTATAMGVVGQFVMVGDIYGPTNATNAAVFTAIISDGAGGTGNILNVSAVSQGALIPFSDVTGAGITPGTFITGQTSGTTGGIGLYRVSASFNIASESMTSTGDVVLGVANGVTTTFSGTLTNIPAYPTSVSVVIGSSLKATDTPTTAGKGILAGTGVTGTVNYDSGAIAVTFSIAPASGLVLAQSCTAYRSRLQWSAIGNPQSWPTPLTQNAIAAQSGINDLEYEFGPVMFIAGYPLYGLIFQREAITRASYIGGQVVFSWQTYARKHGLISKGAAVQVQNIVYYLSDAGFYSTDGANVTPIGTTPDNSAGIDQWFWNNVNTAALGTIRAGYDAQKRCVFFSIPTGSNTLPDTLLTYNILSGRWTKAAIPTEFIWSDNSGTQEQLGLFSQTHAYSLLTGAPVAGYLETSDVVFTDGLVRFISGTRPNILCTDVPTVTIGSRSTLSQGITYANPTSPDPISNIAPSMVTARYFRMRLTSANAQAFHGGTVFMQSEGTV